MSAVLVGDIGGTHSRFGLAKPGGRPQHVRVLENNSLAGLEPALASYLEDMGARPQTAALAVAGPLVGDEVALTNRAWRFRREELARRFGFSALHVVNDFEAIAWALTRVTRADTRSLGGPSQAPAGVKVVLGPGTGLGVAALVAANGAMHVVASEAGHISFGPKAADEAEIFARLRDECPAMSAEMILSGAGLVRLARALDPHTAYAQSRAVVSRALAGEPGALAATALFVRLLGRFAGDMALTFKATGGVYVTGGVAGGLAPLLGDPQFRAAFEAHPPHQGMLKAIPTLLMICAEPGLIGCAAVADIFSPSAAMPA